MTFYFLHPFVHNLEEAERYIKVPIPKHVEWDSKQPELLFVSEWIYYKRRIFKEFKRLWPKAKLRVFYAGEAIEPDFNLFDYAIGFDDCLEYGDRFIRLPSPLDFFPNFIKNKGNNILSKDDARRVEKEGSTHQGAKKERATNELFPSRHQFQDRRGPGGLSDPSACPGTAGLHA